MLPYSKCQEFAFYKMQLLTKFVTCLIIKVSAASRKHIRAFCTSTAAIKHPDESWNSPAPPLVTVFLSWEWIQCWLSS